LPAIEDCGPPGVVSFPKAHSVQASHSIKQCRCIEKDLPITPELNPTSQPNTIRPCVTALSTGGKKTECLSTTDSCRRVAFSSGNSPGMTSVELPTRHYFNRSELQGLKRAEMRPRAPTVPSRPSQADRLDEKAIPSRDRCLLTLSGVPQPSNCPASAAIVTLLWAMSRRALFPAARFLFSPLRQDYP